MNKTSHKVSSLLLALACLCAGASASTNSYYRPNTCDLVVSVVAEETQTSWFQDAPEIRGSVTVSNPDGFYVPITSIVVQARSSDGLLYSALATCSGADGGSRAVVPSADSPGSYASVRCSYRIVLDRRVFGSYAQPGSSSGLFYFPSPDSRASWTVTAIATVGIDGAQCATLLSAPFPVRTECWWDWLQAWHRVHHPSLRIVFKGWGGRKLLAAAAPAPKVVVTRQAPSSPAPVAAAASTAGQGLKQTVKAPATAAAAAAEQQPQAVGTQQPHMGAAMEPGPWGIPAWEVPQQA